MVRQNPYLRYFDVESVKRHLDFAGYPFLDLTDRVRGPLWAITGRAKKCDEAYFDELNRRYGTYFIFASQGSRSTCGVSGWFWVPGHRPGLWLYKGILEWQIQQKAA